MIRQSHLRSLALLIADNVQDTGPGAFDYPEQAVRLHEDDISEAAQDRHGRRLTADEWKAVARMALPMVEVQFESWAREARS